jgi:hypothetical protein
MTPGPVVFPASRALPPVLATWWVSGDLWVFGEVSPSVDFPAWVRLEPSGCEEACGAIVAAGLATCARCGQPIAAAEPFDLDHSPDRSSYLGVSHSSCNRRAGAAVTNSRRRLRDATARRGYARVWSRV